MQSQSAASVFKAAGWTNFQFLIHPPLKGAEECRHDNTDTGYDGGIYLDTPGTNTAIEERVTIKQRSAVGNFLEFGNCLWHHVVVPAFVNDGVADSAFHFQLDDDAPDVADAASESRGHVSPQHYDAPIAPGPSCLCDFIPHFSLGTLQARPRQSSILLACRQQPARTLAAGHPLRMTRKFDIPSFDMRAKATKHWCIFGSACGILSSTSIERSATQYTSVRRCVGC